MRRPYPVPFSSIHLHSRPQRIRTTMDMGSGALCLVSAASYRLIVYLRNSYILIYTRQFRRLCIVSWVITVRSITMLYCPHQRHRLLSLTFMNIYTSHNFAACQQRSRSELSTQSSMAISDFRGRAWRSLQGDKRVDSSYLGPCTVVNYNSHSGSGLRYNPCGTPPGCQ